MADQMWDGIPRREIPWYPTVNDDLCTGCRACIEHCLANVYTWEDGKVNRPVVAYPYNCMVYCKGCANACPEDAISFPKKEQVVALIKELRVKYGA